MRLVVDLQSCQSGSRLGGIGRYSLELAKAMVRQAPNDEIIVILNNRHPANIDAVCNEFRHILPPDNIRVFEIPAGCAYLNDNQKISYAGELIREKFIHDLQPDFVHLTSLVEGLGEEIVTSIGKLGTRVPTAVTVYDLIPFKQQELYLDHPIARRHYFEKFNQFRQANALLAISQYSAEEARRELAGFRGIIANIRGGISEQFRASLDSARSLEAFRTKYAIGERFLLYTASFDRRKNQARLIEAFGAVSPKARKGYKLVIVGNGWPEAYQQLRTLAASNGLAEDDVVFPGRVSDEELIGLYNLCTLFVFPSLWEGLGLPVLEAMKCGAPAIGSNTTSIPEVLGLAEATFDPTDVSSIAQKIEQAITDSEFLRKLKRFSAEQVKLFTWEISAQRAWTTIRQSFAIANQSNVVTPVREPNRAQPSIAGVAKAIGPIGHSDNQLREIAHCLAANELESGAKWPHRTPMRIGWISTWGVRCGIAAYSEGLVDRFPAEVHVLAAEAPMIPNEHSNRIVRCWHQGKGDDLERLHAEIERRQLTDLHVQFNYGFYNFPALNRFVEAQVRNRRRVFITLHSTIDPPPHISKDRLLDIRQALALASAVFIHSDNDIARLAAIGVHENVVRLPHFVPTIPDRPSNKSTSAEVIASYGFFLPKKGLVELIEALGLIRERGRDVALLMVNASYGDAGGVSEGLIAAARKRVSELGLDAHVTMITDFLEHSRSISLLQSADLIVFPYQESSESSSAAVRMGFASRRPVAVTPLPVFDDVAPASHVLPGISPRELAEGILKILDILHSDPDRAKSVEERAVAWRAAHNADKTRALIWRIMERRAVSEDWVRVTPKSQSRRPRFNGRSIAGLLLGNRLRVGARELLVYEPAAALSGGVYRLFIEGSARAARNGKTGFIVLKSKHTAEALWNAQIKPSGHGPIVDTAFYLPEKVDGPEIALFGERGAEATMTGCTLLRRDRA